MSIKYKVQLQPELESIVDIVGKILADAAKHVQAEGFVDTKRTSRAKFIIIEPDLTHRHGKCESAGHIQGFKPKVAK